MQVPSPCNEAFDFEIVQMAGVVEVNATGNLELAVALTATVDLAV